MKHIILELIIIHKIKRYETIVLCDPTHRLHFLNTLSTPRTLNRTMPTHENPIERSTHKDTIGVRVHRACSYRAVTFTEDARCEWQYFTNGLNYDWSTKLMNETRYPMSLRSTRFSTSVRRQLL